MSINFVPTENDYKDELTLNVSDLVADPAPKNSRKKVYLGLAAIGIASVTGAWAMSNGQTNWSEAPQAIKQVSPEVDAPAQAAAVAAVAAAPQALDVARGVLTSANEGVIASRMTAGITSMPYKAGQSFGRGALLASFDCSVQRAQLSAANAATAAYKKSYDTNVELDAYQAVGKNEVGVSRANLGKAQAEANAVSAQLTQCAIYAPFAGKVVEQMAHNHDVAASGQPLLKIQGAGAPEVQLIVPSNWLTWLKPGEEFSFKIDETGQTVTGKVVRLGAAVDPVSKTIRITGSVQAEPGMTILPGMSGAATFDQQAGNGNPA
jgi:membrane fusion protein, multidrug efflux system